eukprot:4510375-Amphidinium_carterae.1
MAGEERSGCQRSKHWTKGDVPSCRTRAGKGDWHMQTQDIYVHIAEHDAGIRGELAESNEVLRVRLATTRFLQRTTPL